MNERYVVSLEIAKKLKKAGFTEDTEFTWTKFNKDKWELLLKEIYHRYWHGNREFISAPSVPELLEQLTNMEILDYYNAYEKMTQGEFIDLFRSPDRLAEIWLEANEK